MQKKTIQFYGPFITNYSFARVNRGLAFGINSLDSEYKAYLSGDPRTLDLYPTMEELNKYPEIAEIFKPEGFDSDILIYNNFPKSISTNHGLKDLPGKMKFIYVPWEETIYPKQWVDEINQNVSGVMAISTFVREVLIYSGVKVPIKVVLNATDKSFSKKSYIQYQFKTKKKIKIFHNSTGKKRKGVDLLLKAYFEQFSDLDDVCLVLKSTPTVENHFLQLIDKFKNKGNAEIEYINKDLSDEELASLQSSVDICVYPSRTEGFGLPILEAMQFNKPVITTRYSGCLDFCNHDNSYLIDYRLEYIDPSEAFTQGSKWAEPDLQDLKNKLKIVYSALFDIKDGKVTLETKDLKNKLMLAKARSNEISWNNSGREAIEFINEISQVSNLKTRRVGIITPVNDESGISSYTSNLYSSVEALFGKFYYLSNKDISDQKVKDADNVIRCWSTDAMNLVELFQTIKDRKIDTIHVQFHSGVMFSIEILDSFIAEAKRLNIDCYLTLHAVKGPSFDFIKQSKNLNLWNKIFIHNIDDYNYAIESLNNVVLFKHPTIIFKKHEKKRLKSILGLDEYNYIIGTHGLLNNHKNIPMIIKSLSELKKEFPNILLICLNAVSANNIYSQGIYNECINLINSLGLEQNVIFVKDFLDQSQIEILMKVIDITLFAYNDVGESASGSIGKSLAAGGVTVVSDISMFSEYKNEVLRLKEISEVEILNVIRLIFNDEVIANKYISAAKEYVSNNSYDRKVLEMLSYFKPN